jgi:O-antigen/teichoic acid export membrane protein
MMGVSMGYLRLQNRATTFVALGLLKSLVQLGCVMLLLGVLGWDLTGVFVGTLVANTIVGGGVVLHLLRATGIRFQGAAARDLVRFGLPLVVTQVATFFTTFGDRYFLQDAVGEAAVGLYALAYSFGFLLFQLGYQSFDQVWGPRRFEIANREDAGVVLRRVFILMNVLLVTAAVGISVFVSDLLRIMSPPAYWAAADLVPIILVAYVLQGWSAFLDLGILVREETRYVTYANWSAAIVAGLGYVFLIPQLGAWGAALSTVAAFSLRAALIYRFSQKLWPVTYDWGPVLRLAGLASATVVAALFIPWMSLVPSVAMRSVVVALYLLGLWTLGSSPRRSGRCCGTGSALWAGGWAAVERPGRGCPRSGTADPAGSLAAVRWPAEIPAHPNGARPCPPLAPPSGPSGSPPSSSCLPPWPCRPRPWPRRTSRRSPTGPWPGTSWRS